MVSKGKWKLAEPFDLRLTLGPLRHGAADPTARLSARVALRASRTPEGPATTRFELHGGTLSVEAWGPGAQWALETVPEVVGMDDRRPSLAEGHPFVRLAARRFAGLRVGRSRRVTEALVPTVFEQKVASDTARRSYHALTRLIRERAPGPYELLLPPDPERVAALPYYAFHRLNVERRRADLVRTLCTRATRLEHLCELSPAEARAKLQAFPGIGEWTSARVAMVALGDADAVPVGDFHIPHIVSWVLAGEPRGSDERMLELLEPYRGQRGRVVRLLVATGARAPRYGPRLQPQLIARF